VTACHLAAPLPGNIPAGIYVHIPFCRYVCPYCDFNVYAKQQDLIPAYIEALETELQLVAQAHPPLGPSPSLFIGGGTPSLLGPRQIERIIDACARYIGLAPDAEITMESNPDNLAPDYCAALKSTGVNRLSIGVQSMQAPGLKVLGRLHGAAGASQAFRAARAAGFDNLSLDFIYGWPGQSLEDWTSDLTTVIDWQPEHVSLYALIIEPGTPYETAVRRGRLHPVDDDTTAEYYDRAVERLAQDGWEHYEISNWARPRERRSYHNQIYWMNGRYYGIGAGAHAFLGDVRSSNARLPAKYIEALAGGALPVAYEEVIGPELAMGETMMLGLRLLGDGVSSDAFARRHGVSLSERYGAVIQRFETLGLMERDEDRVRLSPKGALVSNSVLAEFLP
jgi:oxygen-independent coproporphyrinogen-3 oxidase